ncbi:MAG: 50S ribosomal protein L6 [Alphaproteobacteria bacterium MarineAlpha9_Bin4]|nr:50S ribosomal protein L6 [Pelagibacterales bacterium]PPR24547.1 MAG: 50S ribosomal protein L6 [Alphaproteobacteria bacterium MarineAlpha9_Bin4]|tara:strand:+ start:1227 stop:1760 length:534 start_codon:yes stop_codon:yes gene_type:complete
MSRVGKKPVELPDGIEANIVANEITIKGKKGELNASFPESVKLQKDQGKIIVVPLNETKGAKSTWGMARTLINNMVMGVTEGYTRNLEINGVGYRASIEGNILTLQLGYSHDIKLAIPEDLDVKCVKPTEISVNGISKQKVGQFASEIRKLRKPEPYKGKGIKYREEFIRRKEGKKK